MVSQTGYRTDQSVFCDSGCSPWERPCFTPNAVSSFLPLNYSSKHDYIEWKNKKKNWQFQFQCELSSPPNCKDLVLDLNEKRILILIENAVGSLRYFSCSFASALKMSQQQISWLKQKNFLLASPERGSYGIRHPTDPSRIIKLIKEMRWNDFRLGCSLSFSLFICSSPH